jgi:hypothetical protein
MFRGTMIFGYESFTETADMNGHDFYRVDGGKAPSSISRGRRRRQRSRGYIRPDMTTTL